eukprot:SAG31_NODE_44707_length_261_cov_1.604938_1_plen_77_part_10
MSMIFPFLVVDATPSFFFFRLFLRPFYVHESMEQKIIIVNDWQYLLIEQTNLVPTGVVTSKVDTVVLRQAARWSLFT